MNTVHLPIISSGDTGAVNPAEISDSRRERLTVCNRVPKTDRQINLSTFNIGYDEHLGGTPLPMRTDLIGNQFDKEHDAEIVALQEVVHRDSRPEIVTFDKDFPTWYRFSKPHNEYQDYRNQILSAHPAIAGSSRSNQITNKAAGSYRTNLSVQIAHPSGVLRVFNIHTRAGEWRDGLKQSFQWIKQITSQEPGVPFIIMGDFNAINKEVMTEAKNAGLQVTSTTSGRIDHILLNGFKIIEQCKVTRPVPEGQHDPIFATVERV